MTASLDFQGSSFGCPFYSIQIWIQFLYYSVAVKYNTIEVNGGWFLNHKKLGEKDHTAPVMKCHNPLHSNSKQGHLHHVFSLNDATGVSPQQPETNHSLFIILLQNCKHKPSSSFCWRLSFAAQLGSVSLQDPVFLFVSLMSLLWQLSCCLLNPGRVDWPTSLSCSNPLSPVHLEGLTDPPPCPQ